MAPSFVGPAAQKVYNESANGFRFASRSVTSGRDPGFDGPLKEGRLVETAKQLSVFLENKPGRMANVLSALAREKVNLVALSIMDSHEHSVLRLVVDNADKTRQVAKTFNFPCTETDVLMVELRNQPGALAHVCEQLAGEHINIDYAYCSSGGRLGKTLGIFKVSNTEKAMRLLNGAPSNTVRRRMGRRPMHTRNGKPTSV